MLCAGSANRRLDRETPSQHRIRENRALTERDASTPPPDAITQKLTVASDVTAIYEGGRLIGVNIDELRGNDVAIRQLINTLNASNREKESLVATVADLREERSAYVVQPLLSAVLAAVSIAGTILVGLGINYLSGTNPPAGTSLILSIGVALSLLGALAIPILPVFVRRALNRRKEHHANS